MNKVDRTIGDIIGAVEDCTEATNEELRLTLISLWRTLILSSLDKEGTTRRWYLVRATPKKYLGTNNIPGTEENKKQRALSFNVMKKAMEAKKNMGKKNG